MTKSNQHSTREIATFTLSTLAAMPWHKLLRQVIRVAVGAMLAVAFAQTVFWGMQPRTLSMFGSESAFSDSMCCGSEGAVAGESLPIAVLH